MVESGVVMLGCTGRMSLGLVWCVNVMYWGSVVKQEFTLGVFYVPCYLGFVSCGVLRGGMGC